MGVIGATRIPSSRLRAGTLALLLLGLWAVAVSPIASARHRATHAHVTCAHGELVEVATAAAAAVDRAAAPAHPGSIAAGEGSVTGERDHHHCVLGCAATMAALTGPPPAATRVAGPVLVNRAPQAVVRARAVLADAPKTSPPVAG